MNTISTTPYGLCECGCGRKTTVSKYSNRFNGYIRNTPRRFIRGHFRKKAESLLDRFWRKVEITDTCWLWGGLITYNGYGQIFSRQGSYHISVHRFSWELHNKIPVPEGKLVCHSCDVRNCVNPAHLFIGTEQDNQIDKFAKGRGVNNKLTRDQVEFIRRRTDSAVSLANTFNVCPQTIWDIWRRKTWTWLP